MSDQHDRHDGMEVGWGGLRTPQKPEPLGEKPLAEDHEAHTATLEWLEDNAVKEGDTQSVTVYRSQLERRKGRDWRPPLLSQMVRSDQKAHAARLAEIQTQMHERGETIPDNLGAELHRAVLDLARKDDLSDYVTMLQRVQF